MSSLNLSNAGRPIEAGVILLGSMELLDVAPIDLLYGISKNVDILPMTEELRAKAPEINIHWITEDGQPSKLSANITVQATDSFASCPPLDIVLMGAYLPSYTPTSTELAFVRKSYDDCTAFITICGGMMAAQLAGLLVDKTATAPRFIIPMLRKQDPRTTWVDRRWVRDGKMWTSGALLNGLDLMGAFMQTYWPELAELATRVGALPVRSVEYVGNDGIP